MTEKKAFIEVIDDSLPSSQNKPSLISRNIDQDDIATSNVSMKLSTKDPKNWTNKKKFSVLFISSFAIPILPISISIYYPALIAIREYFNTTQFIVNISVGLFILFMGFIPLVVGSYANIYGRKNIYILVMLIFTISSMLCAIAKNIWILIVMRTLQAFGSSSVQFIGSGIVTDIYISKEREQANTKILLGFYFGELTGPIIGGLLTEFLGWHSIFWFLSIYGSILLLLITFFIPETLYNSSSEISSTPIPMITGSITNSSNTKQFNLLSPFKLLFYPNIILTIIYNTTAWMLIYVLHIIIPFSFTNIYNLSSLYIGLVFLAPGIGCIIGSILGSHYSDYLINKYEEKNGKEESYPELRLKSIWIGVLLTIISFYIFGWILERRVDIIWPLIMMFIANSTIAYTTDSYPEEFNVSILAIGDAISTLISTIVIILTVPIANEFGVGWLFTALTSIVLLSNILIILVYFKGRKWRENQNINEDL
ncbi:7258_t:CDS:2 [Funneliformis caledonium]|uniref:7258_t:CDS:1 n=1 Tax=Funneliformis caledonium TaxID=1117310 RepID=A0A9N8ZW55_9GLOM|nr:7258_t:CDS:2 [Funneliformis caledonium]